MMRKYIKVILMALPPVLFVLASANLTCDNFLLSAITKVIEWCGGNVPRHMVKTINIILLMVIVLYMVIADVTVITEILSERNRRLRTLEKLMRSVCFCIRSQLVHGHSISVTGLEHVRVSLYVVQKNYKGKDIGFACCGRYSMNRKYDEPGRKLYPIWQGVIGEAWNDGYSCRQFPVDEDEYIKALIDLKYSRHEIGRFTMPARVIFARRLDEGSKNPPGMMVVELPEPFREVGMMKDFGRIIENRIETFSNVLSNFGDEFVATYIT